MGGKRIRMQESDNNTETGVTPTLTEEELAEKWIRKCEEHHRRKQRIIDDRVQYDSSLRERMKEAFVVGYRHAEQELEAVKRLSNFDLLVLKFFDEHQMQEELSWTCEGDKITWYVRCSDIFFWGCSDAEDILPANFSELEKAFKDCKKVLSEDEFLYTGHWLLLWVARCRQMRPQGAAYPDNEKLWPLFDAAGPFRETGLGNPYANRTQYKEARVKMKQSKQAQGGE